MQGRTLNHWRLILGMGLVVESVYIGVLFVTGQDFSSPLSLLCFIATALQMVETAAYVLVVTCFRQALINDAGPQEPLFFKNLLDSTQNV
jgi:hypothetical protein